MAIESIGSTGFAQFQPRNAQQTETDNTTVQSFVQNLQEAGRGQQPSETTPPVQTQTASAVQQPAQSQPGERPGTAAAPSFQEFIDQRNEAQGPGQQRPEAGQNSSSALNYSASGTTNPTTNPGQAGRLVSLSV